MRSESIQPVLDRRAEQIELERTRILEGEGVVTHMHYCVKR